MISDYFTTHADEKLASTTITANGLIKALGNVPELSSAKEKLQNAINENTKSNGDSNETLISKDTNLLDAINEAKKALEVNKKQKELKTLIAKSETLKDNLTTFKLEKGDLENIISDAKSQQNSGDLDILEEKIKALKAAYDDKNSTLEPVRKESLKNKINELLTNSDTLLDDNSLDGIIRRRLLSYKSENAIAYEMTANQLDALASKIQKDNELAEKNIYKKKYDLNNKLLTEMSRRLRSDSNTISGLNTLKQDIDSALRQNTVNDNTKPSDIKSAALALERKLTEAQTREKSEWVNAFNSLKQRATNIKNSIPNEGTHADVKSSFARTIQRFSVNPNASLEDIKNIYRSLNNETNRVNASELRILKSELLTLTSDKGRIESLLRSSNLATDADSYKQILSENKASNNNDSIESLFTKINNIRSAVNKYNDKLDANNVVLVNDLKDWANKFITSNFSEHSEHPEYFKVLKANLEKDIPQNVNSLNKTQLIDYRNRLVDKKEEYPKLVNNINAERLNNERAKENAKELYKYLVVDTPEDMEQVNDESINLGDLKLKDYFRTNKIKNLQDSTKAYNNAEKIYNSIVAEEREEIKSSLNKIDGHNKELQSIIKSRTNPNNNSPLTDDVIRRLTELKTQFDKTVKEREVYRELNDKLTTSQIRTAAKTMADFEKSYSVKLQKILSSKEANVTKLFADYQKAKEQLFNFMYQNAYNIESGSIDKDAINALSDGKDNLNTNSDVNVLKQTLEKINTVNTEYRGDRNNTQADINLHFSNWYETNGKYFTSRIQSAIQDARNWVNTRNNNTLNNYKNNLNTFLNSVTTLAIPKFTEIVNQRNNLMGMFVAREIQNLVETFLTDWQLFGRENFRDNPRWGETGRQRLWTFIDEFYTPGKWSTVQNISYYTKKVEPADNIRYLNTNNTWTSDDGGSYKSDFDIQSGNNMSNVLDRFWNIDGYVLIANTYITDLIRLWDRIKSFKPAESSKNKLSSYNLKNAELKIGLNRYFRWYLQQPDLRDNDRRMFIPKGLIRFHNDVTSKL
ncbi:hypothetical protein [Mycoplasma struthionis]|uniref:Uncharacterized protein n=1 Tax=Mycoplasma struthionis TaxID=538220 RepID=A0A502MID5_9MOLU|nr:hypothetical protein [Mycoplasma struthionis]TPI01490.1 hypothetical protein FJM01_02470 [Mycoplasma struthionis]